MLIGIVGDLGAGKTLTMTKLLREDFVKKQCDIYANYHLEFKHKKLDSAFMKNFKTLNLHNCSIGIDEIHIFIDSRSSMKASSKIISYFLLQTRKRNVDLYYTTQFLNQVDKRLRNISDIIIQCNRLKRRMSKDFMIVNTFNLRNGRKIRKVFDPEQYYSMYNTNEIIDFTE